MESAGEGFSEGSGLYPMAGAKAGVGRCRAQVGSGNKAQQTRGNTTPPRLAAGSQGVSTDFRSRREGTSRRKEVQGALRCDNVLPPPCFGLLLE